MLLPLIVLRHLVRRYFVGVAMSFVTLSWALGTGKVSHNTHQSLYSPVELFLLTLLHGGLFAMLSWVFLSQWRLLVVTMSLGLLVQL